MEIVIYRRQRVHYGEQNDTTCLVPKFVCCVVGPSEFFLQRFSIERSRTASPGAVPQIASHLYVAREGLCGVGFVGCGGSGIAARRQYLIVGLEDVTLCYHVTRGHYNNVAWASRRLKSPTTWLVIQQVVQDNKAKPKFHSTSPLLHTVTGGFPGNVTTFPSNFAGGCPHDIIFNP